MRRRLLLRLIPAARVVFRSHRDSRLAASDDLLFREKLRAKRGVTIALIIHEVEVRLGRDAHLEIRVHLNFTRAPRCSRPALPPSRTSTCRANFTPPFAKS